MSFISRISLALLTLSLTACQQPTTYGPRVEAGEVEAESAVQRGIAAESEIERQHKRQTNYVEMEQKLLKVSRPLAKSGAELCVQIRPAGSNCVFEFILARAQDVPQAAEDKGSGINAYADGEKIYVTPGMMRFVENDEELALVLSHELAHNIMGHVSSKMTNAIAGTVIGLAADIFAASQGLNTQGGFTQIGSDIGAVSYSIDFEQEADYVGLYVMSRSGYNVTRALNFWRRFAGRVPEGIAGSVTHPAHPERFVAMQHTLNEIAYKRKHKVPLLPDFKPEI